MHTFRYLLTIVCVGFSTLFAQQYDLNQFQTLKSVGPLPDDFTVKSSQKFEQDKEQVTGVSKREQKDMESFLLESNFGIEDMLHSGRIVYGDPITNYLNTIKEEILRTNPELKQDIRIYTLLSNEVNAFTFDNGIVIVTTGLVAQVQNEAQLAYILCHEFVHYQSKHAITGYVEQRKVERGSGVYGSLSRDEEDLAKYRFAKEQETEADETGLRYYMNTRYSYAAIQGVFDVLLYSYLPIDEIPFPKDYFNEGLYVLPDNVFLDSLSSIEADEDYDDETATHPNIRKRKELVMDMLMDKSDDGRVEFLQSVESFIEVQSLARFQGCELYLIDVEYEDALYQAYVLQQQYPDNAYLKKVIAQSLYGWAMYKNSGSTPDWHRYYKKVQGESQQVYFLFSKLNSKEFTILALKELWNLRVSDPKNQELYTMCKDLGALLHTEHDIKYTDFYNADQAESHRLKLAKESDSLKTDSLAIPVVEQNGSEDNVNKSSKYDKIKTEKSAKEKVISENKPAYWKFAFTEYTRDVSFTGLFIKPEEVSDEHLVTHKKKRDVYHLGLEEVVVVDPIYISVDERSENPVEYVAAEERRVELREGITTGGKDLGMEVTYLDHSNLDDRDVEDFNDMAVLRRWIHETLSHMDEEVPMRNSTNDELLALSEKYGVDHFAWMGVVSFTETEDNVGLKILLCVYVPVAPFLIYDLVTPDKSTFYFTLVANAKTGNLDMTYYTLNDLSNAKSVQASNMYYILEQMSNEAKK